MSYSQLDNYRRAELRRALKSAEPSLLDEGIRFLETDSRNFGSGYLKEMLWKYIRRYRLDDSHITRLEEAAIKYLSRPMSREFKFMSQTMSAIATSRFWQQVKEKLESSNPREQVNAYCLYRYSDGIYAGERLRLELKESKWKLSWQYRQQRVYYSVEALLSMLHEADNWIDGQIVRRQPGTADLPILYYNPTHDHEFATLDISMCRAEILIPKLKRVLFIGSMDASTANGWMYTLYILGQIQDSQVVSTIADFLKTKIDYKFEGPLKAILESAAHKVLQHHSKAEGEL